MSYVSKDGIGMGMPKTYGNGANAVQPIVEDNKRGGELKIIGDRAGRKGVLYAVPANGVAYRTLRGAAKATGTDISKLRRKLKRGCGRAQADNGLFVVKMEGNE